MTIPIIRKRKLLDVDGVNFPSLPSVDELRIFFSKNIVESLQHNPITQPKEYDIEAADILNDGVKIYIGMIVGPVFFSSLFLLFIRIILI